MLGDAGVHEDGVNVRELLDGGGEAGALGRPGGDVAETELSHWVS